MIRISILRLKHRSVIRAIDEMVTTNDKNLNSEIETNGLGFSKVERFDALPMIRISILRLKRMGSASVKLSDSMLYQ